MIDKSLDEPIQSYDEDYILRRIREDYIADSTVTIHLIGRYSAESLGRKEQRFIKRELQASLYDSHSSSRNGILGVVLSESRVLSFGASAHARLVERATIGSRLMTIQVFGNSFTTTTFRTESAATAKRSGTASWHRGKDFVRTQVLGSKHRLPSGQTQSVKRSKSTASRS